MRAALWLIMLPMITGCHHKPVHLPKVPYRVYVKTQTCTRQPDNSFVCHWVRLDPQEIAVK